MKCCADGISSIGPVPSEIMIVGHAPGKDELRKGQPFTGPNGDYLNAVLEAVDIKREEVYLTNLSCNGIEFRPACNERFLHEVSTVKPKLIITLGAEAASNFHKGKKLGQIRGQPYWDQQLNCFVLSTWQPISVVHGKYDFIIDVIRDFQKIKLILATTYKQPEVSYEFVDSTERAQQILDSLPTEHAVALDIETKIPGAEQIDMFASPLICFAINTGDSIFVFDASVIDHVTFPSGVQWLFHNGPFDSGALKLYHNIDLPIVHDTMMQSYALDERGRDSGKPTTAHGYHGLKPLAREYCFADWWEEEKDDDLFKYNAFDVSYTSQLHNTLFPRLIADNMASVYEQLLIPASNCSRDWQVRGVYVDQDVLTQLQIEWIPKLALSDAQLAKYARERGFPGRLNLNSPKQLSQFLYQILGLPGGPSTDKEALYGLEHEFVTALQQHRQLDKLISVNLMGIQSLIKFDHRLHPQPYIHGAATGRFSYHDPNVHNIPHDHTVGPLAVLRKMFAPTNDDYVIMESDYTQIEAWLPAGFSGDTQMLADLTTPFGKSGKPDLHGRVTVDAFGIEPGHPDWSNRRFQAKKITFGNIYDEGAATLANPVTGIGCSLSQAQKFINNWRQRYPTFVEWRKSIHREVVEKGELVSPFGRKRRLPLILDHRQLRQAANFPIQSAASDYTLTSAIKLHKLLPQYDSHILFLVHDSIVMEVNRRYESEVRQLVEAIMTEKKIDYLPSVPVEIKVGPNWYEVQ